MQIDSLIAATSITLFGFVFLIIGLSWIDSQCSNEQTFVFLGGKSQPAWFLSPGGLKLFVGAGEWLVFGLSAWFESKHAFDSLRALIKPL